MHPRLSIALLLGARLMAQPPPLDSDTYNQWKEALRAPAATPAEKVKAPPGFVVELLRSAGPDEGSWIALAFDAKGRAIISREDKGLVRLTLGDARIEMINDTLEEVRGLLFAYDSLYANANNARALFRLRDLDGDDRYEVVDKLRSTPGGVGHGRNQLALGPDGFIYGIHGDDVREPDGGFSATSPFRHGQEDKLRGVSWEKHLPNAGVRYPGGHLVRTDRDGQRWEIVCAGLRNPFGLAFNRDGEAFSYDADMEWDVGLPWYRPTRIVHLLSGADFGWRGGSRALPAFYPDTTPGVADLGKGSPTGCVFGTGSAWPEPWKSALFAADWAYGRIYAVHLERTGPTYRGRSEVFLEGRPLNVTSVCFGPDGAMYFLTGGRRTQSGFYRVRWTGEAKGSAPDTENAAIARRRELDRFHGQTLPGALETIWPALAQDDPAIRRAARVALEAQPVETWVERALGEEQPGVALEAALALARVGGERMQSRLLERLRRFDLARLPATQQSLWLRALQISTVRDGSGGITEVAPQLIAAYPAADPGVNRLLCELLVFAQAPETISKTAPLLGGSRPQDERLDYLFHLADVRQGWTLPARRAWLETLREAKLRFAGGHTLGLNLAYARAAFVAALTDDEKSALSSELTAIDLAAAPAVAIEGRPFVQAWTMESLSLALARLHRKPDLARGERMFSAASCAQCHRYGATGNPIGPDLTDVGRRFDQRALLESILDPWRVVADPYRQITLTRRSGEVIAGHLVGEDADRLTVANNPVDPERRITIKRADVAEHTIFSTMPPALLNTLTAEDTQDLLGWLVAPR